ncbi:MAG: penicillin-binding protein 2 [Verrucomicrobia bacterium]|nr:penicillin-binding protein 2 [Verrucomicrobiota bacterium]
MKRSRSTARILLIGLIMLVALSGLVFRLWYVQIARGAEYTARIGNRSQVSVRIPAVRGEILDRNGIKLVENRASFEVDFYLPDMVRAYRESKGSVPMTTYRGRVHNMPRDLKEADVVKIVSEEVIPRLEELGVAEDYNANALQIHYRTNQEVPYSYRQDLDFGQMAVFSEKNLGLPGVNVTVKPVRWYVYGSLAAHLLGYVGMPNDLDKLPDLKNFNFYEPDMEGKAQIELYLNEYLKGQPGARILQRNVKGVIEGEINRKEPVQGSNVFLTIDARIQYFAEQALRSVGRGAAVVVNPQNGDILAMASVPSYDPNVFIPSIASLDWKELTNDETNPLLNRAISAYAPGSTYKIPVALAGLRAGVGGRTFNCSGGFTYGDKFMKCWIFGKGAHGTLGLSDAIKHSCNAFFYQFGNAAGIDQIDAVGNMLGLGQKSGIPLSGEAPGVLPGPEWLAAINPQARWTSGLTANTSIGQGDVLATPLQMAMVASAVANGGTVYYPRLIDRIVAQDGAVAAQEPARVRSSLITDAGLTAEQVEKVRRGMWKVVNEGGGTAGRARIKNFEVAGKTGTAQFKRSGIDDNHTWFISFAPYEAPRYAVVTFVQGAKSGGGVSAPIAAKILEDILKMEKGEDVPQVAALEPAKGNFRFVESIDFGRDIPAATTVGDDGEAASGADAAAGTAQENSPAAQPNVRQEADDRGRVKNQQSKPNALQKFFNFLGGKKEKTDGGNRQQKPPPQNHR